MPYVLPNPKNIGIAVGISLLSCLKADLYVIEVKRPPSWIIYFRLRPYTCL